MQVLDGDAVDKAERGDILFVVKGAEVDGQRVAVAVENASEISGVRIGSHHRGNTDILHQLEIIAAVGGAKIHIVRQAVPVAGCGDKVRRLLGAFANKGVVDHDRHHSVVFDFPAIAKGGA